MVMVGATTHGSTHQVAKVRTTSLLTQLARNTTSTVLSSNKALDTRTFTHVLTQTTTMQKANNVLSSQYFA